MQPMSHNPGVVGVGAQVVANGTRGLATGTAASAAGISVRETASG